MPCSWINDAQRVVLRKYLVGRVSLFLSIFALLPCLSEGAQQRPSLFEDSPYVTELDPESLSRVLKSSEPWVVNTYSPACPHCRKFAPKVRKWSKYARERRDD